MFLRKSVRKKDGKTHTYWRLVRSVRRNGKVVQETVAQLGELDAEGQARARALARQMTGRADQLELFEPRLEPTTIPIHLDRVRLERSRNFAQVYLAWSLWRGLELDKLFDALLPKGREKVAWSTMAAILVIARLCEPSSELYIADHWYGSTALDDILSIPEERVNDDRLYRALDQLLPHKEAIEVHLKDKMGELFDVDFDLLLYDVTSTYFEGMAEQNELAQRGYSRDHRGDCKQVCLALVVTREGLPLGYEVFAGNRVDVTTVADIVSQMEARFGVADRVWVMDRGMVSRSNIEWLQSTGRRYLLGAARSELKKWKPELLEEDNWEQVRDGLEVKICRGPEGEETFILCRSTERLEKERAMHERFADRIREGLESLERRLLKARSPADRSQVERQIGRLLERNRRAARMFRVVVHEDPTLGSRLRLDWSVNEEWDEWARRSEGCYVLRTNVSDWTGPELWQAYVQLTQAEAAFRIQKSDLSIRPIWHQRSDRVQAHILVCFLAYVLWKSLEQWCQRAGLGRSPRLILQEMAKLHSADIVLPTAETTSRELRIRCVVRPDKSQAQLLDRLGLRLPKRLMIPGR